MEELRVLELFSGIGGMHYALRTSQIAGTVVAAVDINTVANVVYTHNFPETRLLNNNVQKLTPRAINKLDVNTILMSPPCQPFTRVGNQRDVDDYRSDALKHLCDLVGDLTTVDKILMENVRGFEKSRAHDMYIQCLNSSGFDYREFIVSPTQLGVPNTRHRYFCIARRSRPFSFLQKDQISMELPEEGRATSLEPFPVQRILEVDGSLLEAYLIKDDTLLKRAWLLDIVTSEDTNTMCFTKAYVHYCEGTGSVFTPESASVVSEVFGKAKEVRPDNVEYLKLLRSLKLRYFTPSEVARLMSFPADFSFPGETTDRQRYRLLGNSINVLVVSELIKLLCL